jgi:hypothetical protein
VSGWLAKATSPLPLRQTAITIKQPGIGGIARGSFEGRVGRRAHLGPGIQVNPIVADGWLDVCEGGHSCFVMKKRTGAVLFPALLDRRWLRSCLLVTLSYLNYNWFVFTTKGNYLGEWARCVAVDSGGIAISVLLLPVLVFAIRRGASLTVVAPCIGGAVLIGCATIYSFLGHKKFSFRPR